MASIRDRAVLVDLLAGGFLDRTGDSLHRSVHPGMAGVAKREQEMKIDVHIHLDQREAPRWETLCEIVSQVLTNQETMMATLDELNAALATISTEVDKVSADTDNLLAQLANIPPGGLTPEQQAAINAAVESATGIANRLKTIDDKVPDAA